MARRKKGERNHRVRSGLVNHNIMIDGHRTSVRLEPQMWDALNEIARREGRKVYDICSEVDANRVQSTFSASLRVYILTYFRSGARD